MASSPGILKVNRADILDTGKVYSDETTEISLKLALASASRYQWKVMIWDNRDNPSDWSESAWFETGLLKASDWQAKWICGNSDYNPFTNINWIWMQ